MRDLSTERIARMIDYLYGTSVGAPITERVLQLLSNHGRGAGRRRLTEKDALLICYGDMLAAPEGAGDGASGLARLGTFLRRRNRGVFSLVHLLPFHPYTSDDGFSVVDYRTVDGGMGSWEDVERLGGETGLVFDFVVNHGSVSSRWFRGFLAGEKAYEGWYLTRPGDYDASSVVRPRTHPLLTAFDKADGTKVFVWTTFSADQADYDFSNPEVLLEFLSILLEFADRGCRIVRIDAIAYLWKEDGTSCIHHPKTHTVVKLFRAVVDALDLDLLLLTETNVPHRENLSYYGDGDEAHMVYNFALPPLVLHAAVSGDAEALRRWAASLPSPASGPVFLNFLASHDGVGLTPAQGLVDPGAFGRTLEEAQGRGALISYKATSAGQVPYELNCSYLSVISPPELGGTELRAKAFLACHGVLFALAGLPAVYFHSWMGSEHWIEGPALRGYNRAINREKPPMDRLERELDEPEGLRSSIYRGFQRLSAFRNAEPALAPDSPQLVLPAEASVFALLRGDPLVGRAVLCAQNLGNAPAGLELAPDLARQLGTTALGLEPWTTRWFAFGGGSPVSTLEL